MAQLNPSFIGYARKCAGTPLADQLLALQRAGCHPDNIFEEALESGFGAMEMALKCGRPGYVLVVCKLRYLGSTLKRVAGILRRLETQQLHLLSLEDGLDTRQVGGHLILPALATLMEERRAKLSSLTRAGLAAARARGRVGGRPRKMTDSKVAIARQLIDRGDLTICEVAKQLGVARSTVYNSGLIDRADQSSGVDRKNKGRPQGAA